MTLPRPVAWLLLALAFFTAGLLRQSHDGIPASPFVTPIVGSLLFGAVFLLLLVAARERRLGARREPHGVRVGSLTPILLILLVEKWLSVTFYHSVFSRLTAHEPSSSAVDAMYPAFAGGALFVVCLLLAAFSPPAAHRTWRRAHPSRLPIALGKTGLVVAATYLVLWAGTAALGGGLELFWPPVDRVLLWILGGQILLALAEEVYFRGVLLAEMERLAPRLGVHSPAGRRWLALVPTAALFSLEHLAAPPWHGLEREAIFTFSLGLLLGILVMVTNNLYFAAGVHAYINCLLLSAAPRFLDGTGQTALAPGTYVGLALVLAFVLSFFTQRPAGKDRVDEETLALSSSPSPPPVRGSDPPSPAGSP